MNFYRVRIFLAWTVAVFATSTSVFGQADKKGVADPVTVKQTGQERKVDGEKTVEKIFGHWTNDTEATIEYLDSLDSVDESKIEKMLELVERFDDGEINLVFKAKGVLAMGASAENDDFEFAKYTVDEFEKKEKAQVWTLSIKTDYGSGEWILSLRPDGFLVITTKIDEDREESIVFKRFKAKKGGKKKEEKKGVENNGDTNKESDKQS